MKKGILAAFSTLLLVWASATLMAQQPLSLHHAGRQLQSGDSYNIPDNNNPSSSKVALFSEQLDIFTLKNTGGGEMTLNGIDIVPGKGIMTEEFSLTETDTKHSPLSLTGEVLQPGKTRDFYVRFYPVADEKRDATLTVRFAAGGQSEALTLAITGYGRAGAGKNPGRLLSRGTLTSHKLWGGYKGSQDELVSGSVVDAQGNVYFAGNDKTISEDNSYFDVFVVKIQPDGSLGWQTLWHSKWDERMLDPGQNNESGGSADAIAMDDEGFVYLVARVGNGANTNHLALIMKIDPKNGNAVWQKFWRPDLKRLQYTDATDPYAIHVSGSTVYITGQGKYDYKSGIFVVALDTDGNLKWQKLVDTRGDGSADRGHTVRTDGKGGLYLAGLDKGGALNTGSLIKLAVTDTDARFEWAKQIKIGYGSNFNSMDVDSEGNVFLSADRRGAARFFSVVKVSGDGQSITGKTFPGTGSRNATYVTRVVGSSVFAGGKIAISGFDTSPGDALILELSTADLSLKWGGMYYTGTGPNEICEHHVKGIALRGRTLHLTGLVYTGSMNHYRYWGYWYDAPGALEDYTPEVVDVTEKTTIVDTATGGLMEVDDDRYVGGGRYEPLTIPTVEYQNADDKTEATHGAQVDGDVFVMTLELGAP